MVLIAPSIVSAPLGSLQEAIYTLEAAGADFIHFDVEDGCFVPVMNLGVRIIQVLRQYTALPFDVHLMMVNPEWIIPLLKEYGANRVSVHYEACEYPRRTLGIIHQHGLQAGLAFNPKTPLPALQHYRPYLQFVTILTTEPEVDECAFLPEVLQKIRDGKAQAGMEGVDWVADGGITAHNAFEAVQAGADILVSGRGVFGSGKVAENIQRLKSAPSHALHNERNRG